MIGEQTGATKPRAIALPSKAFFSAPAWSPDGTLLLLEDNHLNLWALDVDERGGIEARHRHVRRPGPTVRRRLVAGFAMGGVLEEPRQPPARDLPLLDRRQEGVSGHRRPVRRHRTGLRRQRQVSVLSRQHQLRASDRLARDELGRSPGDARDLPAVLSASEPSPFLPETGDEPAAPPTRCRQRRRRGGGQAAGRGEATRSRGDPHRPRRHRPANSVARRSGGRLRHARAWRGRDALLRGNAASCRRAGPHRASLSAPRTACGAVSRGRSLVHAFRRREEAALSRRWQPLGHRLHRSAREGRRGAHRRRVARGAGSIRARSGRRSSAKRGVFSGSSSTTRRCTAPIGPRCTTKYSPLLPHVAHRADLGYLIASVGGELAVGHSYVTGRRRSCRAAIRCPSGCSAPTTPSRTDAIASRRSTAARTGIPSSRRRSAPPGIQVSEGDYLLEVNGRALAPPTSVYQLFEGTAGQADVAAREQLAFARGIARWSPSCRSPATRRLRTRAWIESNRRLVDKLSGGRLAYVWLPNTGGPGYTAFNRYYYAQQDKEGADHRRALQPGRDGRRLHRERVDPAADGLLRAPRRQHRRTSPAVGIYGPKVMIVNESAGSGGDALPYYFKQQKIGPLVGTRTWGGLVGTLQIPADDRRRRHHRAIAGVLRSQRPSGRSRTKASRRHRGRNHAGGRRWLAAIRSSSAPCRKP